MRYESLPAEPERRNVMVAGSVDLRRPQFEGQPQRRARILANSNTIM